MQQDKKITIIYNSLIPEVLDFTNALIDSVGIRDTSCILATDNINPESSSIDGTDLVITIGGDGTILQAIRLTAPLNIPILGINLGQLGFLTELRAEEATRQLPRYLTNAGWIEERSMLRTEVIRNEKRKSIEPESLHIFHALNDAVIGKAGVSRLIRIRTEIDGNLFTTYRADAVVVSTATGSTGYNLSNDGPILNPQSSNIILKPVAPHLGLSSAFVLDPKTVIQIQLNPNDRGMLSVDGKIDLALMSGDIIQIQRSERTAQFLRFDSPSSFYKNLSAKLGVKEIPTTPRSVF